jgi:hypothetical protein
MPFPRPVDSTLHRVVDYVAGATLMTAFPKLAGIEGTRSAEQIRTVGAVHAGYRTLTDYPLGVVRLLPFKAHLVLDAIGALALAAPFITGQYKKGPRQWAPHVGLSLFELASLAITDPSGKGDFHGDVDAVRRANLETPHRKIYDGAPAVRPARRAGAGAARPRSDEGRDARRRLVERQVRTQDPTLSREANQLLTEELRQVIGRDRVRVRADYEYRHAAAHRGRSSLKRAVVQHPPARQPRQALHRPDRGVHGDHRGAWDPGDHLKRRQRRTVHASDDPASAAVQQRTPWTPTSSPASRPAPARHRRSCSTASSGLVAVSLVTRSSPAGSFWGRSGGCRVARGRVARRPALHGFGREERPGDANRPGLIRPPRRRAHRREASPDAAVQWRSSPLSSWLVLGFVAGAL